MTRDENENWASEQAWDLGLYYAYDTPFAVHAGERDSDRLYRIALSKGCQSRFFDVFKMACQKVWRERGEIK